MRFQTSIQRWLLGVASIAILTACDGNLLMSAPPQALSIQTPGVAVSSVSIDPPTVTIIEGASYQFTAVVEPADASDQRLLWEVTNGTGQAAMTDSGRLTAGTAGTVTVRAVARDGSGVSGSQTVTIQLPPAIPVNSIAVTGAAGATTVIHHSTLQMSAAVLPANATDPTVVWSVTPGTGTATIDTSGLLTATGVGTVTVTATAHDGSGVTGTRVITVQPLLVTSISVAATDLGNSQFRFTATVLPANASNTAVSWSLVGEATLGSTSANPTVIIGNSTGGSVTITATAADGSGITDSETVTVVPKLAPPTGSSVQIHTGFENGRTVTLTAASGAAVYYTTDGTTPTSSSTLYSGPFDVKAHHAAPSIRAIAVQSGYTNSNVFTLNLPMSYYPIYGGSGNSIGLSDGSGVWISYNGGTSFSPSSLNSGYVIDLVSSGPLVYAIVVDNSTYEHSLMGSTDWGATWTKQGDYTNGGYYEYVTLSGSTVYAVDYDGFWSSTETANNGYTAAPSWFSQRGPSGIAAANGRLYLTTGGAGIAEYTLATGTWAQITTADGLAADNVVAAASDGSILYFGTSQGGLSRWDGTTWTTSTSAQGLIADTVAAIAVDGTSVYTVNYGSSLGGASVAVGGLPLTFSTLISNITLGELAAAQGVVYLAMSSSTGNRGVWYKLPGSSTWTTIGGTSHFNVVAVAP